MSSIFSCFINNFRMPEPIQSPLNRVVADKFLLIMNLPDCLKNLQNKYVQLMSEAGIKKESIVWSLTKVSVHSINIKADAIPYGGGNYYVSSHTKSPYNDLTFNFKVDNKYANYFTVYEWINLIYNERFCYFNADNITDKIGTDAYSTNLAIVGTDEYNNPTIQWSFTRAFPVDLAALNLDYQSTEEIDCSCQFKFSQMFIKNFLLSDKNA